MNKLDAGLKRLLNLSRSAAAPEPEQPPFGFAARVIASKIQPAAPTLLQELQQTAWVVSCASLALVIFAGFVLLSQRASLPEPEISSALNFAANNLLQ